MESNLILLKSVYNKTPKQEFFIMPCKNPQTGQFPDHIRTSSINSDGSLGPMILSEKDLVEQSKGKIFIPMETPIVVTHNTVFDLDNPLDKAKWEAIKYSKLIAPDRYSKNSKGEYIIDGERATVSSTGVVIGKYGLADLYIEHQGVAAKVKNDFRKLVAKATTMIAEDSLEGRVKKCKLMEKNMNHTNANDVEDYLMSIAERTPEKIINLYTGTDTANRLLVIDALDRKVVVKRNSLYMYGDNITLGASLDSAVEYLTSPEGVRIKDMIMRETYPELFVEKEKTTKTTK